MDKKVFQPFIQNDDGKYSWMWHTAEYLDKTYNFMWCVRY